MILMESCSMDVEFGIRTDGMILLVVDLGYIWLDRNRKKKNKWKNKEK